VFYSNANGDFASTAGKADDLYTPALTITNAQPPSIASPVLFEQIDSIVPSWVMPSRYTNGAFLVRLHEVAGAAVSVVIYLETSWDELQIVDLNEDVVKTLERYPDSRNGRDKYVVDIKAYKITTIKAVKKKGGRINEILGSWY